MAASDSFSDSEPRITPCGRILHARSDRRAFLRGGAGALAAGTLGVPGISRAQVAEDARTKVAVVRDKSIKTAVRDAVNLSGGMDFIQPGQRVLVKPNATGGVKHPITTNPEVLYEVVKMVAESGCKDILVGDRSFFFIKDVMKVLKVCGHYDAAMQVQSEVGSDVKITVVPFDEAGAFLKEGSPMWRQINHPEAKHYTDDAGNDIGFQLAEILFQVDHVINVPCAKTHFQAWFTMAMKSFVGMSHTETRKFFHKYAHTNSLADQRSGGLADVQPDVTPFTNRLVELNLGFAPALNIIDGTRPVVFGGPSDGDAMDAHTIIASRDRIAADVCGLGLLKTLGTEKRIQTESPWKNPMIHYARKLRIGVRSKDKMEFLHQGLENLADFEAAIA